ncbi:hypothetical protein E2C01_031931 [Portunus trituberculatus]|uniref:Uncharacterized protein n=1 Tax=Portunus trituberculatus TaxID=210409 RepID=A0A5B7F1E8_PORTR|nr:hypothetical protein [Portunus trituberculatus]
MVDYVPSPRGLVSCGKGKEQVETDRGQIRDVYESRYLELEVAMYIVVSREIYVGFEDSGH